MCDDFTAREEDKALASQGLSRREFAAIGSAGLIAACSGGESGASDATLAIDNVMVPTPDGTAEALFIRPKRGKHPGVVMWPDIAGLREAYRQMAARLAASAFAVLVVNHYYRVARAPLLATMAEWRSPEGQAKLKPAIASLSPAGTVRDATAFVAWLDKQPAVDRRRKIGTQGYCQTGSFALRTAGALPGRVGAAASFHGAGLVTPGGDSPHLELAKSRASFLIAIARNDDARSPADKSVLADAAKAAQRPAEIEVYGADHGWCTLDAPTYDKAEADRAWGRLLNLYKGL